jgi:chromosome segregation ATPase
MKVLDAFLHAHNEVQEIEDEITSIMSDVSIMDGAYSKRRTALRHHIDVEVTKRQSKEREEQRRLYDKLIAKQKKEIDDLKEKYADLKSEQACATAELRQQQQTKMAKVEELRRALELKREDLSKEQLLDFFVAQREKVKKRKREDSQG